MSDYLRKVDLSRPRPKSGGSPWLGENSETAELNTIFASATREQLTPTMADLVDRLASRHGRVKLAAEASGLHCYLPSPKLLSDGEEKELRSLHLAINLEKWEQGNDWAAQCMKSGTTYAVSDLMGMPPIAERGYDLDDMQIIESSPVNPDYFEEDENGIMVPIHPGRTEPVVDLGPSHPARFYLASRGYDVELLDEQFHIEYCYSGNPRSRYRKFPAGFTGGPEGRIIFYIMMDGARVGWQARILEWKVMGRHYFYHPENGMVEVGCVDNNGKWHFHPGFEAMTEMPKYTTGRGVRRNQTLMGYDAAVESDAVDSQGRRYCVIAEGPLDAGRLGPPAIALIGKSCSPVQAEWIAYGFDKVIAIPDRDAAGDKLTQSLYRYLARFNPSMECYVIDLPPGYKDLGEMKYEAAWSLIGAAL